MFSAFHYLHAQFSTELSTHWVTEGGAVVQLGGHTLTSGSQVNLSSPAVLCDLQERVGEESWLWHPLRAQGGALSASENIPETWWDLWGTRLLERSLSVIRLGLGLRTEGTHASNRKQVC